MTKGKFESHDPANKASTKTVIVKKGVTDMKKFSTVVIAAILGIVFMAANVNAQTASTSVKSTATIVTPLTATTTAPLAFGTITKGQKATIGVTESNAASFYFSGDESDEIAITIPGEVTISTTSGEGSSMTVSLNRSNVRTNDRDDQNSAKSVNFSSGNATSELSEDDKGNGEKKDGLGQLYVWIGGEVTPAASQQRGNYEGTFTVSAAYSN